MKNYEKYAEKIKNYKGDSFCNDFVVPIILENCNQNCNRISCKYCNLLQMTWLLQEYEEPKVDWSKVAVDTPILVRDSEDEEWQRRYFAKYENGLIYVWIYGYTSWSIPNGITSAWTYAKLAEEGETECQK